MASRIPNSRVRWLTENASTPATPTTAMASATAAKPPKTNVFSRSGVSTSARISASVAACSTGVSGDIRGDAHDAARPGADVGELHYRIGPHKVVVDGVLIREHALRQALADNDHRLAAAPVGIVEIAAGDDRDAERGEEPR